jgi:Tol biopolymer transport system component
MFDKTFAEASPSIFFPVMSPDLKRVFFKMALSTGGDPRSKAASARQGLICYSLEQEKFLFMIAQWGHPAWHPDKKSVVETMWSVYDSDTGARRRLPGLPPVRGDHPSMSPDGKLVVTDTTMDKFGGSEKDWGIVLADARGNHHLLLKSFSNNHGASSWRVSHPHPSFSPDGKRIYFNVSSGPWTQLHVAEIAP